MANGDAHRTSGIRLGGLLTGVSEGGGRGSASYGSWLDEILQAYMDLPPDAISWLTSLAEYGEWRVPGYAEKQNVGDWINFLSTDRGKGWWEALTEQAKQTLQPDYTETGLPGGMGAAQRGSTPENPVFALPPLEKRRDWRLPSAEHPYGIPEPRLGAPPRKRNPEGTGFADMRKKAKISSFLFEEPQSRYTGRGAIAPPARWLLY